ncbi:MAG: HDOD domain-containing protein, partial [archaeon]|nr:HDOD domain-containing protein [archaeon]
QKDKNIFDFFKECFYLRCEIKPYTKNSSIKKRMANDFFKRFPIDIKTRSRLSKFDTWNFNEQVNFSNHFFKLLLQIYQEIKTSHCGIINDINKQDLLVLGRKISVCFQKKEYKMLIVKKLRSTVNLPRLTFNLEGDEWNVFVGSDHDNNIIKSTNVIYNIAFIIWNNFFDSNKLFMIPNASNVTIQEIINLCIKMRNFFSHFDLSEIDHQYYIQKQHITKVMVVVSFEKSPWEKEFNDFCVIYCNSWGELFVRKFKNAKSLKNFLKPIHEKNIDIQMTFYLQRSCTSYEKIIERTKQIFLLDKQIYSTKTEDKKKMPVDIQPPIDYRLKKIQKHISKMPGLPATVTKVIEICDRPTTSPDALNRVISLDPVLTGYVLKLVNSAYYFMINKVTSLTRA